MLGPADVPAIITLDEARRSLDMTLFSGIVHGREPIAVQIGLVLRRCLDDAPDDVDLCYWDAFTASLTAPNRKELDVLLRDLAKLERWLRKAATAPSLDAVFSESPPHLGKTPVRRAGPTGRPGARR